MMNKHKKMAPVAFMLSVVALVLAAVIFFSGVDQVFGLAGTQWTLVSILLAVYAVFFSTHECKMGGE